MPMAQKSHSSIVYQHAKVLYKAINAMQCTVSKSCHIQQTPLYAVQLTFPT